MSTVGKALDILEAILKNKGEVGLADLAKMAVEAGERIKQVAAQAMEEYIDYFTEPIWERGDEEDEEED